MRDNSKFVDVINMYLPIEKVSIENNKVSHITILDIPQNCVLLEVISKLAGLDNEVLDTVYRLDTDEGHLDILPLVGQFANSWGDGEFKVEHESGYSIEVPKINTDPNTGPYIDTEKTSKGLDKQTPVKLNLRDSGVCECPICQTEYSYTEYCGGCGQKIDTNSVR